METLLQCLNTAKEVVLAAHTRPDGDAIGALVGMSFVCEFFKKPYVILLEDKPKKYDYLLNNRNIVKSYEGRPHTFIALDCGDKDRLGNFKDIFEKAEVTINIDHHQTNLNFAQYNYVAPDGSSTSEEVFKIITAFNIPITKEVAEALYTGIVFDTGGFMHSCTESSTHQAVAKLLEVPFNAPLIYYQIIHQKSKKTVQLQAMVVNQMQLIAQEHIVWSYITKEQLEELKAGPTDTEGIVEYLKNIEGIDLAILFYPLEDKTYKVSLRSNERYDVAELAKTVGGGGHARASGATLYGSLEEVITQVEAMIHTLGV